VAIGRVEVADRLSVSHSQAISRRHDNHIVGGTYPNTDMTGTNTDAFSVPATGPTPTLSIPLAAVANR
jgi:hypothetical protein